MLIDRNNVTLTIESLMNLKAIGKKDMNELHDWLVDASKSYYNTDDIIMEDPDYDKLYNMYTNKFGGKAITGAEPPKGKKLVNVKHNFNELVGTLGKSHFIFDKDRTETAKKQGLGTVEQWLEPIFKKYPHHKFKLAIEFKFDGNSVCIEFVNGDIKLALTRGENGMGMDLTEIFKDVKIKSKKDVGVKFEVIITWENFKKLCEDTNHEYANPRNLVAGKLNDNEGYSYYKYMTLVPLWCRYLDREMDREEQIEFIEDNFGEDNCLFHDYRIIEDVSSDNKDIFYDELKDMYKQYTTERDNLPFMIDGIVIEILDQDMRDELGYGDDKPKWANALKFPSMAKPTKVVDFDFCLGDSGIITPRVWFDKVTFNGSTHEKQSLQNYKRFQELKLGIGTTIMVEYHGDCLSYINPAESEANKKIKPMPFITECPECHSKIIIDESGARARCSNPSCKGLILGKIENYIVKMGMKGIGNKTIEKLYEADLISDIISLYTINYAKVPKVEGLGDLVALSIRSAIESKIPYDYEILGSLLIDDVGVHTAKEICKHYTLTEILDCTVKDKREMYQKITELFGFSDALAGSITDGVLINTNTIEYLLERKHQVYKDTLSDNVDSSVEPMSIVFTEFRDEALQFELEKHGHSVKSSVSKKTTVVVTTNPSGTTVKLTKARDLGIPIMSVDEFKKKYGF